MNTEQEARISYEEKLKEFKEATELYYQTGLKLVALNEELDYIYEEARLKGWKLSEEMTEELINFLETFMKDK